MAGSFLILSFFLVLSPKGSFCRGANWPADSWVAVIKDTCPQTHCSDEEKFGGCRNCSDDRDVFAGQYLQQFKQMYKIMEMERVCQSTDHRINMCSSAVPQHLYHSPTCMKYTNSAKPCSCELHVSGGDEPAVLLYDWTGTQNLRSSPVPDLSWDKSTFSFTSKQNRRGVIMVSSVAGSRIEILAGSTSFQAQLFIEGVNDIKMTCKKLQDITTHTVVSTTNPSTSNPSTSDAAASSQTGNMNSDVMTGVTLTLIILLVVAVIVLAVLFIRMKRKIPSEKPTAGGGDTGRSERRTRERDNFDPYAQLDDPGDVNVYRPIGNQRAQQAQMNAAFEPEGDEYLDVFEASAGPRNSDPLGRLEDGYKGEEVDEAPIYHVLDPEAVEADPIADPQGGEHTASSLYAMEASASGEGAPSVYALGGKPQAAGYSLAGAFSKQPDNGAPDYDYSRAYTKPPMQKPEPAARRAAAAPTRDKRDNHPPLQNKLKLVYPEFGSVDDDYSSPTGPSRF